MGTPLARGVRVGSADVAEAELTADDVRVGADIATAEGRKALVLNAISEGRARGLGQLPAQLYQGKEAEEVAKFVATVAGH